MTEYLTTSSRIYDLEGGNKIHAERKDPYGHIKIHLDKGVLPPMLDSEFTSYDEAEKAIYRYINAMNKTIKEVHNSNLEELDKTNA